MFFFLLLNNNWICNINFFHKLILIGKSFFISILNKKKRIIIMFILFTPRLFNSSEQTCVTISETWNKSVRTLCTCVIDNDYYIDFLENRFKEQLNQVSREMKHCFLHENPVNILKILSGTKVMKLFWKSLKIIQAKLKIAKNDFKKCNQKAYK